MSAASNKEAAGNKSADAAIKTAKKNGNAASAKVSTARNAQEEPLLLLDVPTELSIAEYTDLLQQIRHDFSLAELEQEWLDAARYNDIDVLRGILRVHPQFLYYQSSMEAGQHTALHMAAANGHAAIVDLLLAVEHQQLQQNNNNNNNNHSNKETVRLSRIVNAAGNTALHWAAANGKASVVQLLLTQCGADVLQKNQAGRSALTEGFASEDTTTLQYLLEHDSASEEKLVATSSSSAAAGTNRNGGVDQDEHNDSTASSVTHALVFGTVRNDEDNGPSTVQQRQQQQRLQIRELVMARHAEDSILGQNRPEDDTTGLGIWASSLVMAQWMSDVFTTAAAESASPSPPTVRSSSRNGDENVNTTTTTILELGAGCGVPGLVAAAAMAAHANQNNNPQHHHYQTTVYLTDFNPTAVENLQHNIALNQNLWEQGHIDCRALEMNWQDSSTWPSEQRMDVVIGSDLIYQRDMVPLLLQTLHGLRPRRFYYAAPATGRQGQDELLEGLVEQQHNGRFALVSRQPAPTRYTTTNPLQSQDEEECFVHFHELGEAQFILYEFQWTDDDDDDNNDVQHVNVAEDA